MRRPPLSDRAVILLVGVAVIVAAVALAVVLASPAKGSEGDITVGGSDVPGTPVAVVNGGRVVAPPYSAGDVAKGEQRHASSFRDLIAATPAVGDWRYYATGAAAPWEYRWLLEVACGELDATEDGATGAVANHHEAVVNGAATCWPVLWSHGLIDGDRGLCYYACEGWRAARDWGAVDNAFDAVLRAWGVPTESTVAVAPQPLGGGVGTPDTFAFAVERYRPLVSHYFPPDQVANALRVMACESEGNPNAKNPRSSASGLMQHLARYWPERSAAAGWAGADVFDPEANIAVAAWLWRTGGWGHWVCRP